MVVIRLVHREVEFRAITISMLVSIMRHHPPRQLQLVAMLGMELFLYSMLQIMVIYYLELVVTKSNKEMMIGYPNNTPLLNNLMMIHCANFILQHPSWDYHNNILDSMLQSPPDTFHQLVILLVVDMSNGMKMTKKKRRRMMITIATGEVTKICERRNDGNWKRWNINRLKIKRVGIDVWKMLGRRHFIVRTHHP